MPLDLVHALIDWADETVVWLREHIAEGERAGHAAGEGITENLRLYEGVGVLFREAYETRMDEL
jgi:hypothetical protein